MPFQIERRWIEAMTLPPAITPEPPANYNNYMIVNKNYSMGDMDPCPRPKVSLYILRQCFCCTCLTAYFPILV
uniref:Uncharacterized protein n=1 Tax=Parascaris equorum TaxID=6256 RepID=A0A914SA34_PAREQ